MAIYSAVPPPPASPPTAANPAGHGSQHQHTPSAASTVDIEAWTLSALEALSVSPIARGTGTPLAIPIDDHAVRAAFAEATPPMGGARLVIAADHPAAGMSPPRRPLSRRDSQKKREALLKGNEGSRQRRRWENDRLLHVPNVQPPLPTDFEVRPTHPVQHVPYHVAQYWERGLRQRVEEERAAAAQRRKRAAGVRRVAPGVEVGRVPRELRATAKKTSALRTWVRVLEEPVRRFLEDARREEGAGSDGDEMDSEDEEIVFVGRNGSMSDGWKKARREIQQKKIDEGVVFDTVDGGESGAFKRYLTHSISDYYGLDSRSATVGKPPRRVVYVGIKEVKTAAPRLKAELPPPMWELF